MTQKQTIAAAALALTSTATLVCLMVCIWLAEITLAERWGLTGALLLVLSVFIGAGIGFTYETKAER